MGGKWSRMPLGQFVKLQRGHDLPDERRRAGSIPVIGSFGITGWHDEARTTGPGVTVGRSGASFGVVSYSSVDFWPLNTALFVSDFHGNDQRFAYYFLKQFDFSSYNSGSAQPSLNRNFIHPIPVDVPPIEEQRAIAHILGMLDDKIELNRRMNETLEAMAQTVFKSWFVDFRAVRIRRSDGSETDACTESDLAAFPRGWVVSSIYDIADVIYGAPFASDLFNSDGYGQPLIRIRDLVNETPAVWTTETHPKGFKVQRGQIVVSMDGEFRAYIWGGDDAWLNQRVCAFVPKNGASAAFVLNSIKEPLAEVEASETATTVIHLGKNDIDRFRIVVPTPEVLTAFGELCQPLYDRIVDAKAESRTLAALRDTLLPKLISGELRVKDAEKMAARAL